MLYCDILVVHCLDGRVSTDDTQGQLFLDARRRAPSARLSRTPEAAASVVSTVIFCVSRLASTPVTPSTLFNMRVPAAGKVSRGRGFLLEIALDIAFLTG